jgi:hypothetical protein
MRAMNPTRPRHYRIRVRGALGDTWSSAFGGLAVRSEAGQSVLCGTLADQTQLYGVLDQLRDFGIELISVNEVVAS